MKRFTDIILAASLSLFAAVACGQTKLIPESFAGLKPTVARLDSAVTAMYGWEPRDSTYKHSADTLVENSLLRYEADHPEAPQHGKCNLAIVQKTYDDARLTWAEFKRLVDADRYKEALEVYLKEDKNHVKKNAGDFIIFLKHSTQRYVFYSQVLLPLLQEYKDAKFARTEYISVLQLEKLIEEGSMAMSTEGMGYVPDVYPGMVMDLGFALLADGKMDDAQNLFTDIANAIFWITGNPLLANLTATKYAAALYIRDGKPEWARAQWNDLKVYLIEHKAEYDPEALANCIARIEKEIGK